MFIISVLGRIRSLRLTSIHSRLEGQSELPKILFQNKKKISEGKKLKELVRAPLGATYNLSICETEAGGG